MRASPVWHGRCLHPSLAFHDQGLDASARPEVPMSAVPTSGEPQPPAVQQSIAEISRTLDALRERLRRLESGDTASVPRAARRRRRRPAGGSQGAGGPPGDPGRALVGLRAQRGVRPGDGPRGPSARRRPRHALRRGPRAEPARSGGRPRVPSRRSRRARDPAGRRRGRAGRFSRGAPLVYTRPPDTAPRDPFIARFPVRDALAVPVRADGPGGGRALRGSARPRRALHPRGHHAPPGDRGSGGHRVRPSAAHGPGRRSPRAAARAAGVLGPGGGGARSRRHPHAGL